MNRLVQETIILAGTLWIEILDILPYFIFGVALDAIIRTFKLHVKLRQSIEKMGLFAIPGAVLIGVISPLCACGILPIAISLLINGVPLAPVMALLVSSPLMSPSAYTLTAWELGNDWAIAKLIASVFMGFFAGFVTLLFQDKYFNFRQLFKGEPPLHDIHDHDCDPKIKCTCKDKLSNRLAREGKNKFIVFSAKFFEGFVTIGKYTMIGLATEIIGLRYVPAEIINKLIYSKSVWMIPAVILSSIPLYVNQITAAAVLYGFVEKGIQIPWGMGMAFLVGGPVTALPAIAVFMSLFRKRVLYLYLGICVTGSLIVAYTFHFLVK